MSADAAAASDSEPYVPRPPARVLPVSGVAAYPYLPMSPALRGLMRVGLVAVPYPPHQEEVGSSWGIQARMSRTAFGSWDTLMPRSWATSCAHWVGVIDVGAAGLGAGLGTTGAGGRGGACRGASTGDCKGMLAVPFCQPRWHEPGPEREVRRLVGEVSRDVNHLLYLVVVLVTAVFPLVDAGLLECLVGGVLDGEVRPSFYDVEGNLVLGVVRDGVVDGGGQPVVDDVEGAAL